MGKLRVALLQLAPCQTEREALEKGLAFCRLAAERGADIALFPEMWNTGYRFPGSPDELGDWERGAINKHSHFVASFRKTAIELNLAIAITFLQAFEPRPRNTVLLIDAKGRDALEYSKVHLCSFGSERWCSPGTGFHVCDLQTRCGRVKIGAMICFDREFPESARMLMLRGAELVLIPNACDFDSNRKNQLEARAFENMMAMAMANYAGQCGNGGSLAFDGIAYEFDAQSKMAVPRNHLVCEGGAGEAIYCADFDLDKIREYRESEVWGNAYRRVGAYAGITDPYVAPPFIRKA